MTRDALAALAALPLLVAAGPAAAEHEVYYRYVVLGYVKDARSQPVADQRVVVIRDRTGFSYVARTGGDGFFLVVTRLGDESAGETLTVRVAARTLRVTARFDPANHRDDRGTRVDLEGTRFVERAAWFRPTLERFLGPAGHTEHR